MESGMMIDRIMAVADEGLSSEGDRGIGEAHAKKPTSPKIREKWGTRRKDRGRDSHSTTWGTRRKWGTWVCIWGLCHSRGSSAGRWRRRRSADGSGGRAAAGEAELHW